MSDSTQNERFKQVRLKLGMTQEEFGNKIGLSKSGISNIENGTRNVTKRHIKLVSLIFGIDEMWLLTGNEEPENLTDEMSDSILNEKQTASSIIEEVKGSICDNYCKHPSEYKDWDKMLEEVCSSCPLNRL